jgi:hypothetical protein
MNKVPFCGCCAMNVILDISIGSSVVLDDLIIKLEIQNEIQRRSRGDVEEIQGQGVGKNSTNVL